MSVSEVHAVEYLGEALPSFRREGFHLGRFGCGGVGGISDLAQTIARFRENQRILGIAWAKETEVIALEPLDLRTFCKLSGVLLFNGQVSDDAAKCFPLRVLRWRRLDSCKLGRD